jgi:uncharacterized protein (DUF433 family)
MARLLSMFGDKDPREVPLYGVTQAAQYFGVPVSTLRTWIVGMPYPAAHHRTGHFPALIKPAGRSPTRLSFNNLAELQVLATLRRIDHMDLSRIRTTIANLRGAHPLIENDLRTDGTHIYLGETPLLEVSSGGGNQLVMREALRDLQRIKRDDEGRILRLFPDPSGRVVIDPQLSFGKPTVVGTGVTVAVLADFVKAGESTKRLAREFKLAERDVKAVVEWFTREAA